MDVDPDIRQQNKDRLLRKRNTKSKVVFNRRSKPTVKVTKVMWMLVIYMTWILLFI